MRHPFIEFFGWYGAVALLVAFFLVSNGFISPSNVWYLLLNITGAAGIAADSYHHRATQSAVLNVVYALIGIIAILRIF